MAASDPNGQMQFWLDGQPFGGVQKSGNDMGEMQFWFDGQPGRFLFPADATAIKDVIMSGGIVPFAR